jgi:DNA-binding NarL/FixJ family response regulator
MTGLRSSPDIVARRNTGIKGAIRYAGTECNTCGGTLRLVANRGCVTCKRRRDRERYYEKTVGRDRPATRPELRAQRNTEIIALRSSGLTLAQIGDRFGLTREGVRQIIQRRNGRDAACL